VSGSLPQIYFSGVSSGTFRKKKYETAGQLLNYLDEWIDYYNNERTHQGKVCEGRTPMREKFVG